MTVGDDATVVVAVVVVAAVIVVAVVVAVVVAAVVFEVVPVGDAVITGAVVVCVGAEESLSPKTEKQITERTIATAKKRKGRTLFLA